jgi:hypothetical protein
MHSIKCSDLTDIEHISVLTYFTNTIALFEAGGKVVLLLLPSERELHFWKLIILQTVIKFPAFTSVIRKFAVESARHSPPPPPPPARPKNKKTISPPPPPHLLK